MNDHSVLLSVTPHLIAFLVALPLLAAIMCMLVRSNRSYTLISRVFAAAQVFAVVSLVIHFQGNEGLDRYTLGGWTAPLGIDLAVDGLSLVLLLTTSVLVLILSFYSSAYFSDTQKASSFWPLWWLLVAGLNVTFVAADIFNIYVALEMIGLAAVALVALGGTRSALTAALRYALVGLLGSLCYLLGVAILYRVYGTLDFAELAMRAGSGSATWAALSLISVGLLLKTALLPLHFWLPPAHSSAPAPISAILSALVVKASFYLLIRFWLDALNPAVTELAANFLGLLGVIAIIWGCIAALRAQRLKMMVAYSTVAQLGYLFLLFPISRISDSSDALGSAALAAVSYFIVAHAFAKAAMFLAAGNILHRYGHDEINKLSGLVHHQPMALVTFAIAGVSLIGLPPSGGFIAKWLLLNAAIQEGQWWWVAVMLTGSLLAALYIGRVLNIAFSQKNKTDSARALKSVPIAMTSCGVALAVSALLLGFSAEWILNLLDIGTELTQENAGGVL